MPVPVSPQDPWAQVAEVVRLVRTGQAQTRPELADATRLGRNVITLRIQAAQDLGLVGPSGAQRSRGGRAAEVWQFDGSAGRLAVVVQGPTSFRVALTDLDMTVLEQRRIEWDLGSDPVLACERMAAEVQDLLAAHPGAALWGLGVGMLAPVDFTTGRSADPVTAAAQGQRWPRDFDTRGWFAARLHVPVWVESVSNLMALGAAAQPDAPADLIFVRMEAGVGSGIVSDGSLHRGADWVGGELTHLVVRADEDRICVCGRLGCLETFAGEWAVVNDGRTALAEGRSAWLAALPDEPTVADVVAGAEAGDIACVEILQRAADALGQVLASVITWFNPRRVVIGGNALAHSAMFQAATNRSLNAHALAASAEHLELRAGDPDGIEEIRGAWAIMIDALLSPGYLVEWAPLGSPTAAADLPFRPTQS